LTESASRDAEAGRAKEKRAATIPLTTHDAFDDSNLSFHFKLSDMDKRINSSARPEWARSWQRGRSRPAPDHKLPDGEAGTLENKECRRDWRVYRFTQFPIAGLAQCVGS
jgi:hypothetical protein